MSEQTVTLPVTGMTCAGCAADIERGLKKLSGIQDAGVNFAAEQAKVRFDSEQVDIHDLVENVQRSGYKVPAAHVELPVTGMTCANCAANIERTLNKKIDGVVHAAVNFATERAAVDYLTDVVSIENIVAAIERAGYGAIMPTDEQDAEDCRKVHQTIDGMSMGTAGLVIDHAVGERYLEDYEIKDLNRTCPPNDPLGSRSWSGRLRTHGRISALPTRGPSSAVARVRWLGIKILRLRNRDKIPAQPVGKHLFFVFQAFFGHGKSQCFAGNVFH